MEEAKELLPLLLHRDQFCDLAMIAPELRDDIKAKFEEKYQDKPFNERCLRKLENKIYKFAPYSEYKADIENPNVFTHYESTSNANEHSLGF